MLYLFVTDNSFSILAYKKAVGVAEEVVVIVGQIVMVAVNIILVVTLVRMVVLEGTFHINCTLVRWGQLGKLPFTLMVRWRNSQKDLICN